MKKKLLSISLAVLSIAPLSLFAQFGNLMNKVKNKVEQRVDKKIDKAIDNTLDKEEAKKSSPEATPQNDRTVASENKTVKPESKPAVAEKPEAEETPLKSYSKFDFIPGEQILYTEDFEQDQIGELPLNWNTGGKAELVTLSAIPGKWLQLYQNALYLTSNKNAFTQNFTLEFDMILQFKNIGYTYPYVSFGFFSSNGSAPNDNTFLNHYYKFQSAEVFVRPASGGQSGLYTVSHVDGKQHFASENQRFSNLESHYGKVSHFAMQVQGSRFRLWANGEKKFDLPMALGTNYIFNQLFFKIHSSSYKEDQLGIYISNLKVATGKADTRHKLIDEGKFSTNGILFDFQSAVIKPESYGVIKEIASVLKENGNVKIKVIGHTSSDGDDAANLQLSKKRAAAVKEALITEFGIDGSKIETDGKGETQPVADNKSKDGKVLNRRVEFVKL